MKSIKLEPNEIILLQTNDAWWYYGENEEDYIEKIYVTNKKIICKYEDDVENISFDDISIADNNVQIRIVEDDNYGTALQIVFTNGNTELLYLENIKAKDLSKWESVISNEVKRYNSGIDRTQPKTNNENSGSNSDKVETVIIENHYVTWINNRLVYKTSLKLTNKKLYCNYKKFNGLFKKSSDEKRVFLLENILIKDGIPMVEKVFDEENIMCIEIRFKESTERFRFEDSPEENADRWKTAIYGALNIEIGRKPKKDKKTKSLVNSFVDLTTGVLDVIGDVIESVAQKSDRDNSTVSKHNLSDNNIQNIPENNKAYSDCIEPAISESVVPDSTIKSDNETNAFLFCPNCGHSLGNDFEFCPECGYKLYNS